MIGVIGCFVYSIYKITIKIIEEKTIMPTIKKVTIEPGCITCGACEFIAPEVFEVTDISHVKEQVALQEHEASIQAAAQACPVQVIRYDY